MAQGKKTKIVLYGRATLLGFQKEEGGGKKGEAVLRGESGNSLEGPLESFQSFIGGLRKKQ